MSAADISKGGSVGLAVDGGGGGGSA
jgi:hypothetical protein